MPITKKTQQASNKGTACSKTKTKVHSKPNIKRMQDRVLCWEQTDKSHRALDLTRSCWWNWGGSRAKLVASWHTGVRQLAVFSQVGWRWLAVSTLFYHLSLSWCRHRRRFTQWMWSAEKRNTWNNSKCVAGSIYSKFTKLLDDAKISVVNAMHGAGLNDSFEKIKVSLESYFRAVTRSEELSILIDFPGHPLVMRRFWPQPAPVDFDSFLHLKLKLDVSCIMLSI